MLDLRGDGRAGALGELGRFLFRGLGLGLFDLVLVDDVDAHLGEHRHDVLDLVGRDLLGRQHRVQLFIGDVAALLGGLDELLDGGIGKVEQRAVGRLGSALGLVARGLSLVVLGGLCRRLGRGFGRDAGAAFGSEMVSVFTGFTSVFAEAAFAGSLLLPAAFAWLLRSNGLGRCLWLLATGFGRPPWASAPWL